MSTYHRYRLVKPRQKHRLSSEFTVFTAALSRVAFPCILKTDFRIQVLEHHQPRLPKVLSKIQKKHLSTKLESEFLIVNCKSHRLLLFSKLRWYWWHGSIQPQWKSKEISQIKQYKPAFCRVKNFMKSPFPLSPIQLRQTQRWRNVVSLWKTKGPPITTEDSFQYDEVSFFRKPQDFSLKVVSIWRTQHWFT